MKHRAILVTLEIISVVAFFACAACSSSPGVHRPELAVVPPSEIVAFNALYGQNCAGCHGADGKGGAAIALANPVFLAIADDTVIRRITSNGVPMTAMPAFAQSAGGLLTDEQIHVITTGMFSHWGRKGILDGVTPPSYAAKTAGDVANGEIVYGTYCASCHGSKGQGGSKGSAVTNDDRPGQRAPG